MDDFQISTSEEDLAITSKAESYLIRQAIEGRDVEDFLNTAQGRALLSRALQQVVDAIDVFFNEDARSDYGREKLIEAQRNVWRARDGFTWMLEAVIEGYQAETQLDESGALNPESFDQH